MKRKKNNNLLELTYQFRIYPKPKIKEIFDEISKERRLLYNHFLKQYRQSDK